MATDGRICGEQVWDQTVQTGWHPPAPICLMREMHELQPAALWQCRLHKQLPEFLSCLTSKKAGITV